MTTHKQQTEPRTKVVHNLGWLDRVLRVILGSVLLAVGATMILVFNRPEWLVDGQQTPAVAYYLPLISVYPFLTGMFGWDPFYRLAGFRSCGTSPRNPCGSFPFQVDAALGHEPKPKHPETPELSTSTHPRQQHHAS